jgi:hypothetical protein
VNISVICLGYLQIPSGADLLAKYFAKIGADFYLHVDAKVSDVAYKTVLKNNENVHFLPTRVPIWWGGFNTVQAVLAALRYIRTIKHYDRHLLLTEDTVPLLSAKTLSDRLQQHVEFIHSYQVPLDADNLVRRRYDGWYLFDSIATNPRHHPVEQRVFDEELLSRIEELKALRSRGKRPLPHLRSGSSWWGLSDEAIADILELYDRSEWLVESFKYSAIPEEMIFQTLLNMTKRHEDHKPFIYTDFSRNPKPYVYNYKKEIMPLIDGQHCMLRKVDIGSTEIADYMQMLINDSN